MNHRLKAVEEPTCRSHLIMSFWASREGTALILDNRRKSDLLCSEPISGSEQKNNTDYEVKYHRTTPLYSSENFYSLWALRLKSKVTSSTVLLSSCVFSSSSAWPIKCRACVVNASVLLLWVVRVGNTKGRAGLTELTDVTRTLWIMASVQWVARSSAALWRTRLRTWMKMSQQSRRTMLEKAGQKSGGTGGCRAETKYKQREWVELQICRVLWRAKTSITFIVALLSPPLLLTLFRLQPVKEWHEEYSTQVVFIYVELLRLHYLAVLGSWIMVKKRVEFFQTLLLYFVQAMSWNSWFPTNPSRTDGFKATQTHSLHETQRLFDSLYTLEGSNFGNHSLQPCFVAFLQNKKKINTNSTTLWFKFPHKK